MSTSDYIALGTCIGTWVYVGLMLVYVILVAYTFSTIKEQLREQKKARKFQETISIFREIQAKDLDEPRRYTEEEMPESIEGVGYEKLWERIHRIEPVIINLDRVGYLVRQDHIDRLMILETYWPSIWRSWKKAESLIRWLGEQRNEKGAYREYEYLFDLSEDYRIQNEFPEPKFYRVKSLIQIS